MMMMTLKYTLYLQEKLNTTLKLPFQLPVENLIEKKPIIGIADVCVRTLLRPVWLPVACQFVKIYKFTMIQNRFLRSPCNIIRI